VSSSDVRTGDVCPFRRSSAEFLDPRTHSGSIAHEKLRTRTDEDPIPISLARILCYDNCYETLTINTDAVK